jgi:hypothetical protein
MKTELKNELNKQFAEDLDHEFKQNFQLGALMIDKIVLSSCISDRTTRLTGPRPTDVDFRDHAARGSG